MSPTTPSSKPSRRDFLKTTGVLAAGSAVSGGLSVARSAHAQGSGTVKIALIVIGVDCLVHVVRGHAEAKTIIERRLAEQTAVDRGTVRVDPFPLGLQDHGDIGGHQRRRITRVLVIRIGGIAIEQ